MAGRSPEDRQRAAQERAARRAERARSDSDGRADPAPPAPEPEPIEPDGPEPGPVPAASWATAGSNGGDPTEHAELEPLPSARRRPTAVEERRPVSRAAKAQRIGRPGRPVLPPQSPKPKRWFRRFVALIALLAIGAALYVINATFQPFVSDDEQAGAVPVQIPKGADAGSIGQLLEAKGVIDDARFFEINATVTLRRGKLITGNYVLRRHMTNGAAIEALMQGPKVRVVKTFNVGVPEGLSRREAARVLAGSGIEGNYLKATRSREAIARARKLGLPSSRDTIEGFLFPATYELKAGATANDLVDRQLDAFRDNFGSIDLKAAQRRNLSRYDIVTIASMIERETPSAKEKPLIASVIYNRLRLGEPLGIDATIRYDENNWSRPLKESELQKRHAVQHPDQPGTAADADRQPRPGVAARRRRTRRTPTTCSTWRSPARATPSPRRTPSTSATSPPTSAPARRTAARLPSRSADVPGRRRLAGRPLALAARCTTPRSPRPGSTTGATCGSRCRPRGSRRRCARSPPPASAGST